jgi:heme oxygenase (biliverdin-IX-beta and delta-forming)
MWEIRAKLIRAMKHLKLERRVLMAQGSPRYASLRDELRAHTHQQHERLHEHSSFVALFHESLDIAEYRALMGRLHGFYRPLDHAIARAIATGKTAAPEFACAERSRLLAQDMRDLGWSAEQVAANPQCDGASDIVSQATLGGVLYVIEGAMLGGARIDRAARRLLGSDDADGRRFWFWCRSEGGRRWPVTTKYLEDLEAQGVDFGHLKKGAEDTFRLLADWLAPLDQAYRVGDRRVS